MQAVHLYCLHHIEICSQDLVCARIKANKEEKKNGKKNVIADNVFIALKINSLIHIINFVFICRCHSNRREESLKEDFAGNCEERNI